MELRELVIKNRSYRRFEESYIINNETIIELIDLARLSASTANLQPLKYIISNTIEKNDLIFPTLAWAGYLKNWSGPIKGERPSSYIVILGDTKITSNFSCDHGIASQNILLGATEIGLGGCILGLIKKEELRKNLIIPEQYKILLVIALGKPKEKAVIEDIKNDNIKYYRDNNKTHHVPKRSLDEIILKL